MKRNTTGPVPFKISRLREDPFLDAIAKNPRPLVMVLIGIVGMILVMILSIARSAPAESSSAEPETPEKVTLEPFTPESLIPAPEATIPLPTETLNPLAEIAAPTIEPTSSFLPQPGKTYIALIIDDIGNSAALGDRAVSLPGAVTFAVLPHTPFGAPLAEQAHQNGKEVMLHAPMSNQSHMALGPGALTDTLSKEEFLTILNDSIQSVPYLQGINNHMGSTLTELDTQMNWVMESLTEHDLYFVDSLTTAKSVAGRIAHEHNIPTVTRNVFLDNEATEEKIGVEFQRLLKLAKERGSAVGIGHPYKETLDYLEKMLPTLAEQNVELIAVSQMILLQNPTDSTIEPAPPAPTEILPAPSALEN